VLTKSRFKIINSVFAENKTVIAMSKSYLGGCGLKAFMKLCHKCKETFLCCGSKVIKIDQFATITRDKQYL